MLAVVLPDSLPGAELPDELRSEWKEAWADLLNELQSTRPEEGSADEHDLLAKMLHLGLQLHKALGPSWVDRARNDVDAAMRNLLEQERQAAEPEKELSFRLLEKAIDTFGTLVEYVQQLSSSVKDTDRTAVIEELESELRSGDVQFPEDVRLVLRWEFDLVVALSCTKDEPEELAYWAQRAVRGARRVDALLTQRPTWGLHRDLAELRARHAWTDWDDEELQHELKPWAPYTE